MKLLADQTEDISATEFRRRPGDVLTQVQMGKTFRITNRGRVVAVLAAPEPTAFELGAAARIRGEKREGESGDSR